MSFKIKKTQTDSWDSDLIRWWGVGMFISHWYLEPEWFHQHAGTLAGFIAPEQPLDCNLFTRGTDTGHAYMAPTLGSYGWASKETFVKLASSFCNGMIHLDNANYLHKNCKVFLARGRSIRIVFKSKMVIMPDCLLCNRPAHYPYYLQNQIVVTCMNTRLAHPEVHLQKKIFATSCPPSDRPVLRQSLNQLQN